MGTWRLLTKRCRIRRILDVGWPIHARKTAACERRGNYQNLLRTEAIHGGNLPYGHRGAECAADSHADCVRSSLRLLFLFPVCDRKSEGRATRGAEISRIQA